MPTIKNVGSMPKMVADRYLQPGESRSITAKQAEMYVNDAELEVRGLVTLLKAQIVDESPESNAEVRIQKDEEPLQAQPEVVSAPVRLPKRKGASTAPVSTPAPLSAKSKRRKK